MKNNATITIQYGNVRGGSSRTGSGYGAAAAPACRQVPRQECQVIDNQKCTLIPKQECQSIPRKQCTTVSRENYRNVLKQKCRTVPGQSCWNVTRKVPRQECKHIVVENAQSLLTSSAVTAPSRCTAVFLISNAEVCLSRSLERFQDNSAAQFRDINATLSINSDAELPMFSTTSQSHL